MSIEKVRAFLAQKGREKEIMEFEVSSATVELAAQAVGVEGARIAKTLSFSDNGDGCLLIVAAGDARIDNKKFKATFAFKARMLSHEDALAHTGHAVGGVCPFALPEGVKVYCDESLRRFEHVYPACGSSNSAIKLTPDELSELSGASWVDVCKLPEAE